MNSHAERTGWLAENALQSLPVKRVLQAYADAPILPLNRTWLRFGEIDASDPTETFERPLNQRRSDP